jgi:hypothetical protein
MGGGEQSMQEDQLDSYMNSAAGLLGLPLEASWKQGVRENLIAVLHQADFLAGFVLSDRAEPASRYELED